jgi:hypothetical protein
MCDTNEFVGGVPANSVADVEATRQGRKDEAAFAVID